MSDYLDYGPVNDPGYYDVSPIDYGPINDPGYYDIAPIDYGSLFTGSDYLNTNFDFGSLGLGNLGLDQNPVSLGNLWSSIDTPTNFTPYSTFGTDVRELLNTPEWERYATQIDPSALYQVGTPEARALAADIEQRQIDEQALLAAGKDQLDFVGNAGRGLTAPVNHMPGVSFAIDPNTGGFLRGTDGSAMRIDSPTAAYLNFDTGKWVTDNSARGEDGSGLRGWSLPDLRGSDLALMTPEGRQLGRDAGINRSALDFYKAYSEADPTQDPFLGSTSTSYQEGQGVGGILGKLGSLLANKAGGAASNAISRAMGGAGGGSAQPGASATQGALSAAKMAALLYQALNGKNRGSGVTARNSEVRDTGPQAQRAKPARTLYAKGGAVEVPEKVGGGLLPISLAVAHHLANRKGLIDGDAGGQDDVVDIKAAPGEYIFDAETVSALGDGNTAAGAKKLDEMRQNIREHKRAGGLNQIAAKAKEPHAYLKGK